MVMEDNTPQVQTPGNNNYEFKLTILKNDVIAISVNSSNTSNRWLQTMFVVVFGVMILIGAFGDNFIKLYNSMVK